MAPGMEQGKAAVPVVGTAEAMVGTAAVTAAVAAAAAVLRSLWCLCHRHSHKARHTLRYWPTGMSPRHRKVEAEEAEEVPRSQSCPCRDRSHPPAHRSSHRSQTRMSLGSRRHQCLQGRTWERRTPRPPHTRTPTPAAALAAAAVGAGAAAGVAGAGVAVAVATNSPLCLYLADRSQ
jgi:hypothetical protein|eukprot:COSAG06_NODE_3810_length_4886_cov_97.704617_2_plen_177_part_00